MLGWWRGRKLEWREGWGIMCLNGEPRHYNSQHDTEWSYLGLCETVRPWYSLLHRGVPAPPCLLPFTHRLNFWRVTRIFKAHGIWMEACRIWHLHTLLWWYIKSKWMNGSEIWIAAVWQYGCIRTVLREYLVGCKLSYYAFYLLRTPSQLTYNCTNGYRIDKHDNFRLATYM